MNRHCEFQGPAEIGRGLLLFQAQPRQGSDTTVSSKMSRSVAIAGATGAVGKELIGCLERRHFPATRLRLLASERSAGKTLRFFGENVPVEALSEDSFKSTELALFATDGALSKKFVPIAIQAGAIAIDTSSA